MFTRVTIKNIFYDHCFNTYNIFFFFSLFSSFSLFFSFFLIFFISSPSTFRFSSGSPPVLPPPLFQSFLGTRCYCAPEHLRNRNHQIQHVSGACKASDLWSVGVCLFAMLCGYLPFSVKSSESLGSKSLRQELLFLKIKNWPTDMTGDVWHGRSNECKDLVQQLLSKKHTDRPTCDQALEHPWFQDLAAANRSRLESPNQLLTLEKVGENMRKLNVRRKFERGVRVLVNTNKWRGYLKSIRKRRTELHLGSNELNQCLFSDKWHFFVHDGITDPICKCIHVLVVKHNQVLSDQNIPKSLQMRH